MPCVYWEEPRGTPQPPPITGIVRREEIPFRSETCSSQSYHNNVPLMKQVYCVQNRGTFLGLSYRKISGSNQVKNVFIRISNISVPCPHAQLRGRTVMKKLWTYFGPWGRDRCQSPPCWIFLVKQIHPSTASGRTTRQVAILPHKAKRQYLLTLQVSRYCLLALQDSIGEPYSNELPYE